MSNPRAAPPAEPGPWAVCLPASAARAAAALRLVRGIEACFAPGPGQDAGAAGGGGPAPAADLRPPCLWLRGGGALDDAALRALRALPALGRLRLVDGARLVPPGGRLTVGTLPDARWTPLGDVLAFAPPLAALAAEPPPPAALRLVRSERERPAGALLCHAARLAAWAEAASEVRLAPLTLAASSDGRVLVRGVPLPPLPGRLLADLDGLLVPCGWRWDPPLDPPALRGCLGLPPDDLAVFTTREAAAGAGDEASRGGEASPPASDAAAAEGGAPAVFERVPAAAVVRASRSAVRATCHAP